MAKEIINIGTTPNKGDGDPLRTAFSKINSNFSELYTLVGGSAAELEEISQDYAAAMFTHTDHTNITVTYDDANDKIILSTTDHIQNVSQLNNDAGYITSYTVTEGDVTQHEAALSITESQISDLGSYLTSVTGTVTGTLLPDTDVTYDLGSATNRFRDLYLSSSTIDLGGTTISVAGGELQLGGIKIPTVTDLENGTITINTSGDLVGSVFADDSTLLVDGVNGVIPYNVLDGAPTALSDFTNDLDYASIVATQIQTNGLPIGTEASGLFASVGQSLALGYKNSGGTAFSHISLSEANNIQIQADVTVAAATTFDFNGATITGTNFLTSEANDLTSAVTWANVPDANITQSSVTQHQAALSITESQISDFGTYEPADATILKSADIGVSVQAYDANIVSDATYAHITVSSTSVSDGTTTFNQYDDTALSGRVTTLENAGYITGYTVTQADVTQHQAALSITESQISDLGTYIPASEKGAANGVATLDGSGLVPSSQLPSYVDDVLEYADFATFPGTGETGKIYVDIAESDVYRWSGSAYVKVSDAVSSSDQATQLATARDFSLTGDVTATAVSFDGTGNVALATSVTQTAVTQHQAALSITESQISDLQSYLTTETDPVFTAHTSSSITDGTGFLKNDGAGNWSYDNSTYLTSYTETNDLTSAVTWANVPDANITQSSVIQHQAALSITESQISDLQSYLTSYTETDPVVGAVTGIVKSDGAGNISAAVAGTDYLTSVAFGDLTSTPTTLLGYGITDAATSAQGALADSAVQPGDNISTLTNDSGYLTSVAFGDLTSTPTTLSGYGITDAHTKTYIDGKFTNLFAIGADDSTMRTISQSEGIKIIGGTNISTTSDSEGNITITNDFTQDFAYASLTGAPTTVSTFTNDSGYLTSVAFGDLTSTPTTLAGYGITDAVASSSISTFGASLIDDADASAARTTLGLGSLATLSSVNDAVYTPTTSSDWNGTPPTTIGEAIDRLAALVKTLNGGTGA